MALSRNVKIGLLTAAACLAAGASAAYAVTKLNPHTSRTVTGTSALRPGVIGRVGGFGFRPAGRPFFGGRRDSLSAAATYLGLSESALFAKLGSGRTLAQIAQATSGKSVSGLIDAMTVAEKSSLDAAVTAGRLSQGQADRLQGDIKARIAALVNGAFGFRGGFGDRGGPPSASPL